MNALGRPRLHFRCTDSTNARAYELAVRGAPHGTMVTAAEQTAGRGRQGRVWVAPPGRSLLCSVVVRNPGPLLSLTTGVAVADLVEASTIGRRVEIKWPNDVLIDGGKVAGILVEGRPQERWAILGIGINVALDLDELPEQLRGDAATLGLAATASETVLDGLLTHLARRLSEPSDAILREVRQRDALRGNDVRWSGGIGIGDGIDAEGRLLVAASDGRHALDAGEIHLIRARTD